MIALTPQGRQLDQALVEELVAEPSIAVLSSRFEGFDARIVDHLCTDAISIGPYVLSGGELPAMVLLDAIARRLPGALAEGSGENESFSAALDGGLEYPHYTRPAEFSRLAGPRRAPLREPRPDRRLAGRAEPRAEHRVSDVDDRPEDGEQPPSTDDEARPARAAAAPEPAEAPAAARSAYGAPAPGRAASRAAAPPDRLDDRRRRRDGAATISAGRRRRPSRSIRCPYTPPGQDAPPPERARRGTRATRSTG